ncbi:MAG TPA: S8 family serine peptidase, partial [Phycisphaerales bacterium]|nr:S8 family serine peptidase [Phycisphaerales bacterium]
MRQVTGGSAAIIAVLDSGVDFTHPDLRANRWLNRQELENRRDDDGDGYADDLDGWDYITDARADGDASGHGTAVGGLIVSAAQQRMAGLTWHANLMSLRVLDAAGQGDIAAVVEAIDYAITHGAQVINCSWGTDYPSVALREAVERAARRNILVVSAAGNGGRDLDASPRFPASFDPQVTLSVASTDSSDLLAPWSNRGAVRVAVAAQGEGVIAAKAGGGYAAVTGSSASAALASGVAGLIKSLRPGLSAARTREVILGGARRVPALQGLVASGGVLNPVGALSALDSLSPGEEPTGGDEGDAAGDEGATPAGADPLAPAGAIRRVPSPPTAAPPTVSARPSGLPNLDEARRLEGSVPRAIPPVPSTMRRCPPNNPRCDGAEGAPGRPNSAPSPTPTPGRRASAEKQGSMIASVAGISLLALASAALNGGRPVVGLTELEYYTRGGYALSDAPDGPALPALPAAAAVPIAAPLIDGPADLRVTWASDVKVSLSWAAAPGAVSYVIERRGATTGFAAIAAGVTATGYDDLAPSVSRGNAYLYRVRAVNATGLESAPSNVALGTAFTFLDDPIILPNDPQGRPATPIRAQHIKDLRQTVEAVRALVPGIGPATWTNPAPTPNVSVIAAADVRDLRGELDEALSALGIPLSSYFDNQLAGAPNGTPVRKIHIDQLRERSTRGAAGGGGGVVGTGTGLTGKYYNGINFNTYVLSRTDPRVEFDWGGGAPAAGVTPDHFSVRWTGMIQPPTSEEYTIYAYADDGVRVLIDGHPLIDNWADQVPTEHEKKVTLTAGRLYSIAFEYYENFGGATARLSWKTPTRPKEVVPQSQLYTCWKATDQFVGDFFQGALGRQPSAGERQEWTNRLTQAPTEALLTAESKALGSAVFNSAEYAARNPDLQQYADARQYVGDLYRAFLQREPDQAGWEYWTNNTLTHGRAQILADFDGSPEYYQKVLRLCDVAATTGAGGTTVYNFSSASLDPLNRTGGGGADAYSRNYNWGIPILSLPGRAGLDLGLTLSYNSLVWTRDRTGVTFDADHGFPGPGFRLGFPTVRPKFYDPRTKKNTYILVTPSGARVELRQTATDSIFYESADSSYLHLTEGGSLTLAAPDGTRMLFSMHGGEYRCD